MCHVSKALPFSKAARATLLAFSAVASVVVLTAAADPAWRTKPFDQWTEQDAKQVLAGSPWVKWTTVKAYVPKNEDQLRQAGKMGGGQGVGLQGLDPKGFLIGSSPKKVRNYAVPSNALQIRWESSATVSAAELKVKDELAPDWKGEYYAIAVYGVPIPPADLSEENNNWNLKKLATLKRAGKKDLKPVKVDVSVQTDKLSLVLYLFPREAAITTDGEYVEFEARIGRIMLNQIFDTAAMRLGAQLSSHSAAASSRSPLLCTRDQARGEVPRTLGTAYVSLGGPMCSRGSRFRSLARLRQCLRWFRQLPAPPVQEPQSLQDAGPSSSTCLPSSVATWLQPSSSQPRKPSFSRLAFSFEPS